MRRVSEPPKRSPPDRPASADPGREVPAGRSPYLPYEGRKAGIGEKEEMKDSFGAASELQAGGTTYRIHRLDALGDRFPVDTLPYSLKVLLENVLRLEDGVAVTPADAEAIAGWDPSAQPSDEIPFQPARVLMQDFTGVPAVVDLAAMRDAMASLGGEPSAINPLVDVDLVIDHSVQVDAFGSGMAFQVNAEREFERNRERYEFLKWGQGAFDNFRVVPRLPASATR